MKVGIVIPLKAKVVSKSWHVTTDNLKLTLNSINNQSSNLFECVVVGHDYPSCIDDFESVNDKIRFFKYETFSPPRVGDDESKNQLNYEFDRCNKILEGIIFLKKLYPDITHWFSLDADDLLHRNFVEFMQASSDADAIIIDYGYVYFKDSGVINHEDEFSAYCGSSALISDKLIDVPDSIDETSYRTIPFGSFSHVNMRKRLQDLGHNVYLPRERVVMYVRNNGENISNAAYSNTLYKKFKKFVKMIVRYRLVDNETKKSFGLK